MLKENYYQEDMSGKGKHIGVRGDFTKPYFAWEFVKEASRQLKTEVFPAMHNDLVTQTGIVDPL